MSKFSYCGHIRSSKQRCIWNEAFSLGSIYLFTLQRRHQSKVMFWVSKPVCNLYRSFAMEEIEVLNLPGKSQAGGIAQSLTRLT